MTRKADVVPIKRGFCAVHLASPDIISRTSCEPANCGIAQNHAEVQAALLAVGAIATDLRESLTENAVPILGSELGSVLAIQALNAFTLSELRAPVANSEEQP